MVDNYCTIVDIGTSKVTALIGSYNHQTRLVDISGFGVAPCSGLRNGVIVNVKSVTDAINKAITEAEETDGNEARNIYIGISGGNIQCKDSPGMAIVAHPDKEIEISDKAVAIETAKTIKISEDHDFMHVFLKEYIVDEQRGIKDPLNMSGKRLEVVVYIITASYNAIHNAVKCVNEALNAKVETCSLSAVCSAYSVLTDEEKKLGVIMFDLGAGTSDIVAYNNSSIHHISCFEEGGDQITSEISRHFKCTLAESERLKINYGCAVASLVGVDEMIDVQIVGSAQPQKYKRRQLAEIIEKKMTELLLKMKKKIIDNRLNEIAVCGIVLTGGVAEMKGIQELFEKIIEIPARLGEPYKITGFISDKLKKNKFASAVGLLNFVFEDDDLKNKYYRPDLYERIVKKFKEMIGQLF